MSKSQASAVIILLLSPVLLTQFGVTHNDIEMMPKI